MSQPHSLVHDLHCITDRIVTGADLQTTLRGIVDVLREVLGAERCSIMLKSSPDCLRIRAALGLPEEVVSETAVALGSGIAGTVAQDGVAKLLHNAGTVGGADKSPTAYAGDSAICVPLRCRGEVIGVINLSNKRLPDGDAGEFSERDLTLASVLANQAALAISQAEMAENIEEQSRLRDSVESLEQQVGSLETQAAALALISRVTDSIMASGTLDEVLSSIVRRTTALLAARRGSLMLVEPGTRMLRMRAAVGVPEEVVERARTEFGVGIAGLCAESGQPILIRDADDLRSKAPNHEPRISQYLNPTAICVPIKIQGEVLGVLNINDRHDGKDLSQADLFVAQIIANQAAVAIRHSQLLEESVEGAASRRALGLARQIQQAFVPLPTAIPGLEVAGRSIACEWAGGDYVDYWVLRDEQGEPTGQLVMAIGDVSGHGVGAALIMASVRASLRALLGYTCGLEAVLRHLNQLVRQDVRAGQFVTLFLAIADPAAGRLTYASAGHGAPLSYRPGESQVRELDATGPPLGVLGQPEFPTCEVDLAPGDVLALATDGVWEVRNEAGEQFGRERLVEQLRQLASKEPLAVVTGIQRRAAAWGHPVPLADDFSLIVAKLGDSHADRSSNS